MAIEINIKGEVLTAYLKGELDHHTAKGMRETIDSAVDLNMPSLLILDFKGAGGKFHFSKVFKQIKKIKAK